MLRRAALLLLIANLLFFAWTQGWLDGVTGLRAQGDREPERLARQVRPESVVILPPSAAVPGPGPAASAPPSTGSALDTGATTVCLEAGPFATGAARPPVSAAAPRIASWAAAIDRMPTTTVPDTRMRCIDGTAGRFVCRRRTATSACRRTLDRGY